MTVIRNPRFNYYTARIGRFEIMHADREMAMHLVISWFYATHTGVEYV